jgi:hypothetical protein
LVKGLASAVRYNDDSAADRYRRRLSLIAKQFDTNPPVHETLERLLWASGQWLTTDMLERGAHKKQILELTKRVMELVSPS